MTIKAFPNYILESVPASLRVLANKIESGDVDALRVVVCIEDSEGDVDYKAFGEDFTVAHAVGICFAAMREIDETGYKEQ